MYTQCPECLTYFQVSPDHLKIAHGNVRCGQCRNVFSALGNLTENPPGAAIIKGLAQEPPSRMQVIDLEDSMDDSRDDVGSSFEENSISLDLPEKPRAQKKGPLDLSHAIDTLKKTSKGLKSLKKGKEAHLAKLRKSSENSPADSAVVTYRSNKLITSADNLSNTLISPHSGESAVPKNIDFDEAFRAIDELDIDIEEEIEEIEEIKPKKRLKSPRTIVESIIRPIRRAKARKQSEPEANTDQASTELTVIPQQLLADFQQRQEEIEIQRTPAHLIWGFGSMFMMIIFLLQTVYFKHDDLADNPNMRPWIEKFCTFLACDVSLPVDIKRIELLGQDIRSHPKIKGALMVSATVINNAPFTQLFPGLLITFSDMNGQKVAMRRFVPKEYLTEKQLRKKGLIPNLPLQIELGVRDPGKNAINFEFDFFPYKN